MRISLINYEGDCLWALNTPDGIVVYDQWESLVEILTEENFLKWVDGEFGLTDSEGKEWFYTKEHRDARATAQQIFNFLKNSKENENRNRKS